MIARDAGERQARSLPELVVVDLGDGRAEALLELRLRRLDVFALPFQRARFRKVQLGREDSDVTRAHSRIEAGSDRPVDSYV